MRSSSLGLVGTLEDTTGAGAEGTARAAGYADSQTIIGCADTDICLPQALAGLL